MSAADIKAAVEYRAIPGFPEYRAGSDGSVWSRWQKHFLGNRSGCYATPTGPWKKLKPYVNRAGHLFVSLRHEGKYYKRFVHRLVLEAFEGPCPDGYVTAHNNGKPADNRLSNLRWDTQAGNVRDKLRHGTHQTGEKHPRAKLNNDQVLEIRRLHKEKVMRRDIAKQFGVCIQTIDMIVQRRYWKHI